MVQFNRHGTSIGRHAGLQLLESVLSRDGDEALDAIYPLGTSGDERSLWQADLTADAVGTNPSTPISQHTEAAVNIGHGDAGIVKLTQTRLIDPQDDGLELRGEPCMLGVEQPESA